VTSRARSLARLLFSSTALIGACVVCAPARADDSEACVSAAEESQPLRREGHLRLARGKLLFCARPTCPSVVSNDCKTWLADVEGSLASISLRVTDGAAHEIADARVSIDGEAVTREDRGVVFLEPGKHHLHVERSGSITVDRELALRASEHDKPVAVELLPSPDVSPRSSAGAPSHPETQSGGAPASAYVLGAVGLVAMGAGAYFWVTGRSDYASLKSSCGVTSSCAESDVSAMKKKLEIGDVVFGVGLLSLGAGLYVGLSSSPSSSSGMVVQPMLGGASLSFTGRLL
jgi:hypothetical protein